MKIARAIAALTALGAGAALSGACSASSTGHDGHAGHDHHATGAGETTRQPAAPTAATGRAALKKIAPSANYRRKTCLVSGDPLDAMGERLAFEYQGQEVQFCCDACIDEFLEEPAKFLGSAKADAGK